eukprot:870478-Prymnesium_polylepis.2
MTVGVPPTAAMIDGPTSRAATATSLAASARLEARMGGVSGAHAEPSFLGSQARRLVHTSARSAATVGKRIFITASKRMRSLTCASLHGAVSTSSVPVVGTTPPSPNTETTPSVEKAPTSKELPNVDGLHLPKLCSL